MKLTREQIEALKVGGPGWCASDSFDELCDMALAAAEAEPVAWVIPGQDTARDDGFLNARMDRDGEFTRPLYAHPPATGSDNYVGYCRYSHDDLKRIKMCDSDADGAFKVYRHPASEQPEGDAERLADKFEHDGVINLHYESDLEAFNTIIAALRKKGKP